MDDIERESKEKTSKKNFLLPVESLFVAILATIVKNT